MATEKELRNEIRKHVRNMLAESTTNSFIKNVGSQVRASLGSGRSMLDKALGGIDVERLAKLPKMKKVGLLTTLMKTFGITADELTALRGQVARGLKADSTMEEGKLNELKFRSNTAPEKPAAGGAAGAGQGLGAKRGGLTAKDLGGASNLNRAEEFITAIKKLEDADDKLKAIGYVLANIGVTPEDLVKNLSKLKTAMRVQSKGLK